MTRAPTRAAMSHSKSGCNASGPSTPMGYRVHLLAPAHTAGDKEVCLQRSRPLPGQGKCLWPPLSPFRPPVGRCMRTDWLGPG